ncbi:hypothetical protein ACS4JF_25395 [Bacillus thuringiensis]|uniref:hypothetical protein n=1 Tax=Bacillus thuringiensis TaxID=1428 RepID=UPI001FAD475B|nr:hypothetical protein [Bacillus thuringiensis]MDM8365788.1 hypothetical protein [Bacillus thuringiensis]HDT6579224.1 hypothetical protein [Bacillus cereus]
MKAKESFKRMSISEMKAKREALRASKELDKVFTDIDRQIEYERLKTIRELGYSISDNPTHEEYQVLYEQLHVDGMDLDVRQTYNEENKQLTVEILVLQVARSLTFDLRGENDGIFK